MTSPVIYLSEDEYINFLEVMRS